MNFQEFLNEQNISRKGRKAAVSMLSEGRGDNPFDAIISKYQDKIKIAKSNAKVLDKLVAEINRFDKDPDVVDETEYPNKGTQIYLAFDISAEAEAWAQKYNGKTVGNASLKIDKGGDDFIVMWVNFKE